MAVSDQASVTRDVPLEEIVFSCSICQATPSEIYATKHSNQGFNSGFGDEEGIVTKLWIAECSHVFCGKHLSGGAAPFHPKDTPPRAPCPHCQREKGDENAKDLYAIRGLHEGEYDAIIPPEWMRCPAMKLDGAVPGMEAVRFQYNALALFARRVRGHWKDAQQKQHSMEATYAKERKQRRQLQSEVLGLTTRVSDLEKCEAKLKKWEARKPVVEHYLSVVIDMAEDIEIMRTKLAELGFQTTSRNYAFIPGKETAYGSSVARPGSIALQPGVVRDALQSSSSRKRKHDIYNADALEDDTGQAINSRGSSRDLMPPPLRKSNPRQRNAPVSIQPVMRYARMQSPSSRYAFPVYEDQSAQPAHPNRSVLDSKTPHGELQYSLRERQSLPLRPSPYHAARYQSAHGRQAIPDQPSHPGHATTIPSLNGPLVMQPFEQLSLSPTQQQSNGYDPVVEHNDATQRRGSIGRGRQAPRITHYDADYGTAAQQKDDKRRQPLQPLPDAWLNQQRPGISRATNAYVPPSPLRARQQAADPASSPFLRRESATSHSVITQPVPMSNSYTEQDYALSPVRYGDVYDAGQSHQDTGYTHGQQRSDGFSSADPSYRLSQQQQLYVPPTARLDALGQSERPFAVSQITRNSQGLFERRVANGSSAAYARRRPQSTAHRGRVSFPPDQQPTHSTADRQEYNLSRVPGVRDFGSHSSRGAAYQNRPPLNAPRDLLSSAGARRGIRR